MMNLRLNVEVSCSCVVDVLIMNDDDLYQSKTEGEGHASIRNENEIHIFDRLRSKAKKFQASDTNQMNSQGTEIANR